MKRRPNQIKALADTTSAIDAGKNRIVVVSPTGSGKTLMLLDMIDWARSKSWPVTLYTHRRMLLEQTRKVLSDNGMWASVRASGYSFKENDLFADVAICMTQTELSQVYKNGNRDLHRGKLVLIDEPHIQTGQSMVNIVNDHESRGAAIVSYTATPLDIWHIYRNMIVACTNSEAREFGALVPAKTFAPDEPDLKHIRRYPPGEDLTESDAVRLMMRPGIFGRVINWYRKINPEERPTLLFGPGVAESTWFCEQFHNNGISAAHIDGENVVVDGKSYPSSQALRDMILERHKDGDIRVICNRFVLREGIDMPWASHCIFATVFGSLTSYIQSGGRMLRSYPGKQLATIQDHGGNWWRHGSLNQNWQWEVGKTCRSIADERVGSMTGSLDEESGEYTPPEVSPIACPMCGTCRNSGRVCPSCGYAHSGDRRSVIQINGELVSQDGPIYEPKKVSNRTDEQKKWDRMYYRMRNAGKTFRQAEVLFRKEHGTWPQRCLHLMPKCGDDWKKKIAEVPNSALT